MIGIYDYTVVLTYLSLLSAGTGIVVSLSGMGHPFLGIFFPHTFTECLIFTAKCSDPLKIMEKQPDALRQSLRL